MSVVNVQGIRPLIDSWLERKLGQLPTDTLAKVKEAVRFVLEWYFTRPPVSAHHPYTQRTSHAGVCSLGTFL